MQGCLANRRDIVFLGRRDLPPANAVRRPMLCRPSHSARGQSIVILGFIHAFLCALFARALQSSKKGGVVHLLLSRGHCIAFWPSIPPLQVAPSFACSVASLSRSPGLQLPGCHSLHCGILADYLLGWGRPSTCSTGHAEFQSTSSPSPHWATGDWVLPAKGLGADRVQGGT